MPLVSIVSCPESGLLNSIKESLYSTAVIEAAYKSIQNNSKWIEIDPIIK